MIFGDPGDFAIEAEIEPDHIPPSAPWGRMRVWCHGNSLGDFQEPCCGLCHAADELAWIAGHLEELWDTALTGLDDQTAWDFLDELLYGYRGDVELEDNRTLDELHADSDRYAKLEFLTNWGEQFDGFKSFILCPPGNSAIILSRAFPADVGISVQVSREGLVRACRAFATWFDDQTRKLN